MLKNLPNKLLKLPRRTRIIILATIALVVVALSWWLYSLKYGPANGELTASGTVEAIEVQIAPEISGKIVEIMVNEGDSFRAGDPLFRLDDTMLQAQYKQAAAALQAAQDNLAVSQSGVDAAQDALKLAQANAEAAKANAQAELLTSQQALDDLLKNAEVAKTAAQEILAEAIRVSRDAQYQLDNFTVPSDQNGMTAMEAIAEMQKRLDKARADFEPYKYEDSGNQTRKDLKEALDNAQSSYDAAVRRLELETALEKAIARQNKAARDLEAVKDGPKPEDVATLKARIEAIKTAPRQADATVSQSETGVSQAKDRLQQAQSSANQAQAALDLIDIQLQKLTVYAPISGVLLARGIELGEVVQAGAAVMTAGELEKVYLTVYVPEDRYGEIKLGQQAKVRVDSFPGKVFSGTVTNISDKAEYTPRNVQTVEGRKTTVFAVRLTISNPDLELKLGMPADVTFE